MTYALEGIQVIDLAQMWAGPGVSMYLGDQGAAVIKVEPRLTGDSSRTLGSTPFLAENSLSYMVLNRNKRSVTLDIRTPEGREVLLKLVERADVIIENFRPGVAERLGIGYEDLNRINPRIIYGSVTGYGTKGPYSHRPAYDRIVQGLSGAMFRRMPDGTPIGTGIWIADCSVAMLLAYGVMLALWEREKTGLGQKVETSLLQAAVAMQSVDLVLAEDDPTQEPESANPAYDVYRCADGVYINIAALTTHQFARLLTVMDLEHLNQDPRSSDPSLRNQFRSEVSPILEELLKTKTSEEWLRLLDAADVPSGPVIERSQVFFEPQIVENEMLVSVSHPKAGRTRMLGIPIQLSDTPGKIPAAAPLLGEHTEDVLRELGYSPADISELKSKEVI